MVAPLRRWAKTHSFASREHIRERMRLGQRNRDKGMGRGRGYSFVTIPLPCSLSAWQSVGRQSVFVNMKAKRWPNQPVERTGSSRYGQVHSHDCGGCSPSLTSAVGCDMKSHSPLLSVGNLTKPCLSRQVFQGSMRWTGGRKATVQGVKPSRQCSQPGSLNPGAALESDGTVKLIKHSQASSKERAIRGCLRLRPK